LFAYALFVKNFAFTTPSDYLGETEKRKRVPSYCLVKSFWILKSEKHDAISAADAELLQDNFVRNSQGS